MSAPFAFEMIKHLNTTYEVNENNRQNTINASNSNKILMNIVNIYCKEGYW